MLIIRASQRKALERDKIEQFGRQVVADLKTDYPDATVKFSEQEIETILQFAIDKIQRYEITVKRDIRTFISFSYLVNPHFDKYPKFKKWLTSEEIPANQRMSKIVNRASAEDWEQASAYSAS